MSEMAVLSVSKESVENEAGLRSKEAQNLWGKLNEFNNNNKEYKTNEAYKTNECAAMNFLFVTMPRGIAIERESITHTGKPGEKVIESTSIMDSSATDLEWDEMYRVLEIAAQKSKRFEVVCAVIQAAARAVDNSPVIKELRASKAEPIISRLQRDISLAVAFLMVTDLEDKDPVLAMAHASALKRMEKWNAGLRFFLDQNKVYYCYTTMPPAGKRNEEKTGNNL